MICTWMPVLVFLSSYLALSGLGSLLLLFHIEPFTTALEQQAGFIVPFLTSDEKITFLYILIGGPLCFIAAYKWVTAKLSGKKNSVNLKNLGLDSYSYRNVQGIYYFCLIIAILSLHKGGAFSHLSAWKNYDAWINARWTLFSILSFFEFVNMYTVLPFLSAFVLISYPGNQRTTSRIGYGMHQLLRWLPTFFSICVGVLLYQKKPILQTIIISTVTLLLFDLFKNKTVAFSHIIRRLFMLVATLISVYLIIIFSIHFYAHYVKASFPAENYQSSRSNLAHSLGFQSQEMHDKVRQQDEEINPIPVVYKPEERPSTTTFSGIKKGFLQTFLNLFMRTAGPALFYPVIFPEKHEFFPIDIGQDVIGFGGMPDDNRVIWDAMYPEKAGAAMAPINFVLYSQGGVLVVFLGMALVGAYIGACWCLILNSKGDIRIRSLLGTVTLLFSLHIGMDSLRNITLSSYGFLWPTLFIFFLAALAMGFNGSRNRTKISTRVSNTFS